MKKYIVLALTVLMVLGLVGGVVGASEYDNWKGELAGRERTVDDHYFGDAEGHVIFNYRKGQQDYMINLVAEGLKPNKEYEIVFLTLTGDGTPERVLTKQTAGYFVADEYGDGHLNVRGFSPGVVHFDEEDYAFFSIYYGAWRVATTWGDAPQGAGEDIEPVGSNRGE